MIQGQSVTAEIEAPAVVEVQKGRKTANLSVRISLHNSSDCDFIAHARNQYDELHWHVFDQESREVQRKAGKSKAGDVGVSRGVHSYRTLRVPAGQATHSTQKLTLDADKLEPGAIYTIRGEIFGHVGESSFAVVEGRRQPPAKKKAAKKPAKKVAAKRTAKKATRKPARKAVAKRAPRKKPAAKSAR